MALEANFCRVQLETPGFADRRLLLCTRRARLAHGGEQVMVGDWVGLEGVDWQDGRAAIASLEPRHSLLQRPALANADRVVVVVALAQPNLEADSLSRFLLSAEATGLEVLPVLSKADLVTAGVRQAWLQRIQTWGYGPICVSQVDQAGIEQLRLRLDQGISVLCGPSGVGKSSLLNALLPQLQLRTAAVSGKLQRGRHTTRHVELFPIGANALLADTPGFNRPEIFTTSDDLASLFPEIRRRLKFGKICKFNNCMHQGEKGCAVDDNWDRYKFYISFLEDILKEQAKNKDKSK
jgi:ribosome biogenesis GTPase